MNITYLRNKELTELYAAQQNPNGTYTLVGFHAIHDQKMLKVFNPEIMSAVSFDIFKAAYLESNERQYGALKQMYESWYPTTPVDRVV